MKPITLAHSDLTKTIYAIIGKEKVDITNQAIAEVNAIKALEQEPKTEWIPVSERLPKEQVCDDGYVEPSASVLIQLNNKEMKVSRYWGSRESYKDKPWIDLSYPTTLEVIAWQPLPKPYSDVECAI